MKEVKNLTKINRTSMKEVRKLTKIKRIIHERDKKTYQERKQE